jgi:hypothetical protein
MDDGSKDIYPGNGAVSKDTHQMGLSASALLKSLVEHFRVVVCGDNGPDYGQVKKIIAEDPYLPQSERTSPDQFIKDMRNNPPIIQMYTNLMKAVGQPTSCEVPMSALPTPVNLASARVPGRGQG